MSDEVRDPILAAVAITRAQLMKITGEKTTKATLEATALEVSTAADPLEVVNALGLVSAHAVVLAAATMAALGDASGPAALIDTIETSIRGGES